MLRAKLPQGGSFSSAHDENRTTFGWTSILDESKVDGVNQQSSLISRCVNMLLCALVLFGFAGCSKNGEIHDAADSGDVEKVRAMLKTQPDLISSRNLRGNTPLFHARDTETAEVLLDYKPDVNATNFFGETALLRAISFGRASVAELLLAHGANVNLTTMDSSPLCKTMSCGNRTAPHLTELLLAHGADVNFKSGIDSRTALHWAVINDLTDCVKLLLAHGADINARDFEGETPLFNASREVAKFLISHGANVNAKDNNNCTPLGFAAFGGDTNMIELLLASHAEIDAKGYCGTTALCEAAHSGRKDVVEILLANHADVNAKDDEGRTPLHHTTIWAYADVAELLLANKADVNTKDNQGKTPLDVAATRGPASRNRYMMEFLRQHGGHE